MRFLDRFGINYIAVKLRRIDGRIEERMGKFYSILEQNTWEISKFVKRGHIENSIYGT